MSGLFFYKKFDLFLYSPQITLSLQSLFGLKHYLRLKGLKYHLRLKGLKYDLSLTRLKRNLY